MKEERRVGGFYRSVLEMLTLHWPELNYMVTYSGKRDWEMETGCMPSKKRTQVAVSTHSLCHMLLWPLWSILPTCRGPFPLRAFAIALPVPFINSIPSLADEKSLRKGSEEESHSIPFYSCIYLLHSTAKAGTLLLEIILFIVCLLLIECKLQEIKDFVLLVHCHIVSI